SSLTLSHLTNIDSDSVDAQNGATLTLAGVIALQGQSYTTELQSESGATLNLPNLTTLHGAGTGVLLVYAIGGTINAAALTSISDGATALRADGPGVLDVSGLTTFVDNSPYNSTLEAHAGGNLKIPNLAAPQFVNITLDGATSQMNTAQFND